MILSSYLHVLTIRTQNDAISRISFTTDVWSDPQLKPYMAITAHYFVRTLGDDGKSNLTYRSRLLAFRHIPASHTGVHLAETFIEALKPFGILHKVRERFRHSSRVEAYLRQIGCVTTDNASNNSTMMQTLERELSARYGVILHKEFNHIRYVPCDTNRCMGCSLMVDRCFPHVVNIAVQTALKALSESAPDPDPVSDRPEDCYVTVDPVDTIGLIDEDYTLTLNADVVARVRELVRLCRSSSLRRAGFIAVVLEGNKQHWWGQDANGNPVELDALQLLRDVDTRWSSTYLMIDRVLKLVPVCPALKMCFSSF